jgi:hypothetical protein
LKIEKTKYKNIFAISVETKTLTAIFLPDEGSKLASLKYNQSGDELLEQGKDTEYKRLTTDGDYVGSECSGFDDMFPTIDPFTPDDGPLMGVEYCDHGEVCRMPFEYKITENSLEMHMHSDRYHYDYTKTISENEAGGLTIHYRIENNMDDVFDFLWAAHIMIKACDGGEVLVPFGLGDKIEFMFGASKDVRENGGIANLTKEYLTSKIDDANRNSYKYYFNDRTFKGCCGYFNPKIDKMLLLSYDKDKLPFLGIWMNDGYLKEMNNIALEPCTMAFDRVDDAKRRGQKCFLEPRGIFEFDLNVDIYDGKRNL